MSQTNLLDRVEKTEILAGGGSIYRMTLGDSKKAVAPL
jgi:hypothetical protein